MSPVRVAVIGAGCFGRNHIRLLSSMDDVELVAVVDADERARQQAAKDFGVTTVADHRELQQKIDAAVLAVPTRLHHRLGMELLQRGVHLMVEKPLATCGDEARELVETAAERGRILQVGHIERFNPALEAALPHVDEPRLIEARRTAPHRFRSTDIGVVFDLMIHDLDIVLSLVRAPLRHVEALGVALFGRHEDIAQARLTFDNGCVATLTASRASYELSRQMHIWSQRGFASIDFDSRVTTLVEPSAVVRGGQIDAETLSQAERQYLIDHLFDEFLPMRRIEAGQTNQLEAELRDFVAAIRQGRRPRVSGDHGLRAIEVADAILASIARHAWDGSAEGRVGPHLATSPHVLQGPHWLRKQSAAEPHSEPSRRRREAG